MVCGLLYGMLRVVWYVGCCIRAFVCYVGCCVVCGLFLVFVCCIVFGMLYGMCAVVWCFGFCMVCGLFDCMWVVLRYMV